MRLISWYLLAKVLNTSKYHIAEFEAAPKDHYKQYVIDLGQELQALKIVVEPFVPKSLHVVLCPETCSTDGSCQGVPYDFVYNPAHGHGQKNYWKGRELQSGIYTVGVHAKDLLEANPSRIWYLGVKDIHDGDIEVDFRVKAYVGESACTDTGTNVIQEYGDTSCAPYINYPTLDANIGGRASLPTIAETVAQSTTCSRDSMLQVWCQQMYYKCGPNGVGIKPCPSVCSPLQQSWLAGAAHGCAALPANSSKALNSAICQLAPPSGSSNFGEFQEICFGQHKGKSILSSDYTAPPLPCEPVHYTCETPECYLTARPLSCVCKSEHVSQGNPQCIISHEDF